MLNKWEKIPISHQFSWEPFNKSPYNHLWMEIRAQMMEDQFNENVLNPLHFITEHLHGN